MELDDANARIRFLIHDPDASSCAVFDMLLADLGIKVIRTGIKAPRQNGSSSAGFAAYARS